MPRLIVACRASERGLYPGKISYIRRFGFDQALEVTTTSVWIQGALTREILDDCRSSVSDEYLKFPIKYMSCDHPCCGHSCPICAQASYSALCRSFKSSALILSFIPKFSVCLPPKVSLRALSALFIERLLHPPLAWSLSFHDAKISTFGSSLACTTCGG